MFNVNLLKIDLVVWPLELIFTKTTACWSEDPKIQVDISKNQILNLFFYHYYTFFIL